MGEHKWSVAAKTKKGRGMNKYKVFLEGKKTPDKMDGFDPIFFPERLFPFQRNLVEWAIIKGRCALYEDCGLGKTLQELSWAENVVRKTNKPVLILTPLAVAPQFVDEGNKFGIGCHHVKDGNYKKGINVINYERLHFLNPKDFAGVAADESSILKNYDGKRRRQITNFLKGVRYRLLATATPAPNDWMELGSSCEALEYMNRSQMLSMFFTNGGESTQQWVLKGHAKSTFWKWMCSWARAIRKPSDIGFDDDGFILPKLSIEQHIVKSNIVHKDDLFSFGLIGAKTLSEQRAERRGTIKKRCKKVASLVDHDRPCVIWCHLNEEGDYLENAIPDAVQVAGKDSEDRKEELLTGFSKGKYRVLITKPKIGCFGLNWQHCNHMVVFPSHSYEQYYQAVRRCWRFGQKKEVKVDIVTSEGERYVINNMIRKEKQASEMFSSIVQHMSQYQRGEECEDTTQRMKLPEWLTS